MFIFVTDCLREKHKFQNQLDVFFCYSLYNHICAFILMANVRTYQLHSLLNVMEQFCHPLPNELDQCALLYYIIQRHDFVKMVDGTELKKNKT